MLLAIVLIMLPILLSVLLQKRFECMLAPFICGLILVCYGLAMFQGLGWLTWLLLAAVAATALALLLKALRGQGKAILRSLVSNVLTPGFCCFVLLSVLFYFASRSHYVMAFDDLNYWAIEVRSIFAHNGLVDAVHHLAPNFMLYTPGMQLFQWVGMAAVGEWSEPTLYVMLWTFQAAFLLPFTRFLTWKKAYWMPAFLGFILGVPTMLIAKVYPFLHVDTALGILTGYAFCQAWLLRKPGPDSPFTWVCFILSLCALVLVKQMGTVWALMALTLLLFVSAPQRKGAKPAWIILAIVLPAIVLGSWTVFCQAKGLSGMHVSRTSIHIKDMLAGRWTVPEHMIALPSTLWTVLTSSATALNYSSGQWLELPRLFWVVFFIGFPLVLVLLKRGPKRTLVRLALVLLGWFVLFLVGFSFALGTAFYEEFYQFTLPGMSLQLQRYLCPYLYGSLLLFAWAALEGWTAREHHALGQRALYGALAALVVLCCSWPAVYGAMFTVQPEHRWQDVLSSIAAENFWMDELEQPESAIVLYGQDSIDSELYPRIRYVLAPVKIIFCADGELTPKGFEALLKSAHITHVIAMDEDNPIYENALAYAQDEWIDPATLYEVSWEDGAPVLSYY